MGLGPNFEQAMERDERAMERCAIAFERIATVFEAWYNKAYPIKPEPKDATVTRIPSDLDELKEAQGNTDEPIEEWIGLREQDVITRQSSKRTSPEAKKSRSAGKTENKS